jgi:hypothetical protein
MQTIHATPNESWPLTVKVPTRLELEVFVVAENVMVAMPLAEEADVIVSQDALL